MIVWLRGPSGSGKSRIAHQLLETYGPGREVYWPAGVPLPGAAPSRGPGAGKARVRKTPRLVGYELPDGLFVLGPYHVPGGGLDLLGGSVLRTQIPLVERAARRYRYVLAESLTAGNVTPGHFLKLRDRLPTVALPLLVPVLDTPADDCLANIYDRQRRNGRPHRRVNEDVIRSIAERIHQYQQRGLAEGLDSPALSRSWALGVIVNWFQTAGWAPERVTNVPETLDTRDEM